MGHISYRLPKSKRTSGKRKQPVIINGHLSRRIKKLEKQVLALQYVIKEFYNKFKDLEEDLFEVEEEV